MGKIEKINCKEIHKEIDEIATEIFFVFNTNYKLYEYEIHALELVPEEIHFRKLIGSFNDRFLQLYNCSESENYLWQFCPFQVYESFFEKRKLDFFKELTGVNIVDFCHSEIMDFNASNVPRLVTLSPNLLFKFFAHGKQNLLNLHILEEPIRRKVFFAQRQKIEFLKPLMKDDQNSKNIHNETTSEVFFDFSDSSQIEKIVFLHELGILEFLYKQQPFNTSINKLAEAISAFTGIKQTTAQSYLNPILSKGVDQSKSPLTEKNLKAVKEKLMKMGYFR